MGYIPSKKKKKINGLHMNWTYVVLPEFHEPIISKMKIILTYTVLLQFHFRVFIMNKIQKSSLWDKSDDL